MGRSHYQRPNVLRSKGRHPYWYFRYRIPVLTEHGPEYREAKPKILGRCRDMGKREAERLRDEFLQTINDRPLILLSQIPFSKFLDVYRKIHLPTVRESTAIMVDMRIKNHIEPYLGHLRLCDITREKIAQLMNNMADKDSAWHSRRRLLSQIHHIFAVAQDLDYWQGKNPAERIKLAGEKPDPADRVLVTIPQYQTLLARLPDPYCFMVRIAMDCGLRIGEIRGLKWGDVDFSAAMLNVRRQLNQWEIETLPKTPRSCRSVPLGYLIDEFRLRRKSADDADWIFPPVTYMTARMKLLEAAKAAGINIPRFGWHTFRCMHATMLRTVGGADPLDVMRQLGHTSLQMTSGYSQTPLDRREQLIRRLQERLMETVQ